MPFACRVFLLCELTSSILAIHVFSVAVELCGSVEIVITVCGACISEARS